MLLLLVMFVSCSMTNRPHIASVQKEILFWFAPHLEQEGLKVQSAIYIQEVSCHNQSVFVHNPAQDMGNKVAQPVIKCRCLGSAFVWLLKSHIHNFSTESLTSPISEEQHQTNRHKFIQWKSFNLLVFAVFSFCMWFPCRDPRAFGGALHQAGAVGHVSARHHLPLQSASPEDHAQESPALSLPRHP